MLGVNQNNKLYATTVRASKGLQIGHKHNPNKDVLNVYSSWRRLDIVLQDNNVGDAVANFADKGTYIRREGDMITISFNFEVNVPVSTNLLTLVPLTPISNYIAAAGTVYANTLRLKNPAAAVLTNITGRVYIDPAVSTNSLFIIAADPLEASLNGPYTANGQLTFRAA
jgi:hypothetical protein